MLTQVTPPVSGISIPDSLAHLADAVERSRWMLDLEDDWDQEGSPGYSPATWTRAVRFLLDSALRLPSDWHPRIPAPAIHNGPEGSIDLHWDGPASVLLINMPADPDLPAEYFGRDRQGLEISGTLQTNTPNEWLLMWLTK